MTRLAPRLREAAAVTAAAVALTVYFTWPLALRPAELGRVDAGDGQFAIWNVAWVAHAIVTPGVRVFDANIFHPNRRTLAYSEANLGAGLLAVPGYWLTRNAFVAHNSAVLIGMTLAVVGTYFLALHLSRSRAGAALAAIVFAFCPFVFAHTAHVQLLMIWPLPFVMLALHGLVARPAWPRALLLGAGLAVQALFCAYWGVMAGLMVAAGVLYLAFTRGLWRRPHWWGMAALAALASILLVWPFFLPYLEVQNEGFGRSLDEARVYSSTWRDYLASAASLHTWMLPHLRRWGGWVEVLFPGFAAIALATAGLIFGLRQDRTTDEPGRREATIFYLAIALLSIWASLGPRAGLYSVLYNLLPVFELLRAPARFGLGVVFAVALLAAIGLAGLLERLPARWRAWPSATIILFAIVELSTPLPLLQVPPRAQAHGSLAAARPGPVAEFPFYFRDTELFRHARYMLASTVHWQPLINGYSDHIPQDFKGQAHVLWYFPDPRSFEILRQRRVRYVVINPGLYTARNREALTARLNAYRDSLRPIASDEHTWLLEIVRWPEQHPDFSDRGARTP